MIHKPHVVIIGSSVESLPFKSLLERAGVAVTAVEDFDRAFEVVQELGPDAIIFILQVYWESITEFVKRIRSEKDLADTPLLYLGQVIEGQDQQFLKQYGVQTLTLGPVPKEEAVRFIINKVLK